MIMICSSLRFSTTTVVIKRFRRLFLVLPISMLLIGCDSPSSTRPAANSSNSQASPIKSAQNTDRQNSAETSQDTDSSKANSNNAINDIDDSQSLIAATRSDDSGPPMFSGTRNNSALQATLMGDYGGILPCSFCDNIDITLNLFADSSVLKTTIYNNPTPPKVPLIESGIYRQDDDTITIIYETKVIETYRIQENHLVMLDQDQQPNADYTLSRK